MAHICESEEAERKTNNRLVETLNDWKEEVKRDDLMDKVENSLRGKPVIIFCKYKYCKLREAGKKS